MVTVVHNKVSSIPDKQDELAQGKVCPSHWNEDHVITGLVAADSTYTPSGGMTSTNVQDAIAALASSVANYQTLANSLASHAAGVAVGTYPMAFQRSANLTTSGTEIIPIYAADYASFGGLTPKLRIRAQVFTNATAPTASFQFGLYPISANGGAASNIAYTMGTVVTGSTTGTVTTPSGTTSTAVASSDFDLPSDGLYCFGVIQSANTTAASSLTALSAQLQIHYV